MAWRSGGSTNAELINNLFKNGLITTSRVKEAMLKVGDLSFLPSSAFLHLNSISLVHKPWHFPTRTLPGLHGSGPRRASGASFM
jgi:protein-L-isoaspartate(D-aspartate) O-methyltransferase